MSLRPSRQFSPLALSLFLWVLVGPLTHAQQVAEAQAPDPPPAQPPEKPLGRKGAGGLLWHDMAHGLGLAKKQGSPLLLVYPGAAPGADLVWADLEKRSFSTGWATEGFKQFIAVAVEHPLPEIARSLLGAIESEAPVVCLCDYRGTVLKRWQKQLPERDELRKEARSARARSEQLVTLERRVLELLKKSRYALNTEKYRESVTVLLEAEGLQLPADSDAVGERVRMREDLLKVVATRREKAAKLEEEKKYIEAINSYELIMKDFPLPELTIELRQKIAELWRHVRGVGG
ncbi:MAG: hypothetical protein ACKVX7_05675 [Planctomycetota bacterium]